MQEISNGEKDEHEKLLERDKNYKIEIECLKQKLYGLETQIGMREMMLKERQSYLEEKKQTSNSSVDEKKTQLRHIREEHQKQLNDLRDHNKDLDDQIAKGRKKISAKKAEINERNLKEKQSKVKRQQKQKVETEIEEKNSKLNELGTQNEHIRKQFDSREKSIKQNTREVFELKETFQAKRESLAKINEKIAEIQKEIKETSNKIENSKQIALDPSKRGNSMFAEVEDRSEQLQKKLSMAISDLQLIKGQRNSRIESLKVLRDSIAVPVKNWKLFHDVDNNMQSNDSEKLHKAIDQSIRAIDDAKTELADVQVKFKGISEEQQQVLTGCYAMQRKIMLEKCHTLAVLCHRTIDGAEEARMESDKYFDEKFKDIERRYDDLEAHIKSILDAD